MQIPAFPADANPNEIAAALNEAGAVVINNAMDDVTRASVREELAPYMEAVRVAESDRPEDFYPGRTRRASALMANSPTARELAMNQTSRALCDQFLKPNAKGGYQLHVTAALEVGPGARKQVLHREEDPFSFFPAPRPNMILASMWAVSDFRADNGATLIVPTSHTWEEGRTAEEHEVLSAEMPAGSVLYWMGGTLHGAGANTSNDWRYGVILTYSLGWLRQEENQYLDVPPEVAATLSPELREMIGYNMYGGSLGFSVNSMVGTPDQ